MPAKENPQAPVKDDDISRESGVLTLDSEVAGGVEDWLAAINSTTENEVPANNATDTKAVTSTDSEENEVTATMGTLEDDHEDEFLATTSSINPEGSHDTAESEEEVEDEILESVSNFFIK